MLKPAFFVSLALLSLVAASAAPAVIWQIGTFDRSSLEFSARARGEVRYRVGRDDWRKDWPGEERAGATDQIDFELASPPEGAFALTLSLIAYSPRIPALRLELNGHSGMYYLHPRVSYYLGDPDSAADPHYATETLRIELPAAYLKAGANVLALSCVDEAASGDPRAGLCGLHYDALSLSHDAGGTASPGPIGAVVTPTAFFRPGAGGLVELVDAVLHFPGKIPSGSAHLRLGGRSYAAAFSGGDDFGERRLEFAVPEWTGEAKARLEVEAGARAAFDLTLTAKRKWTVFLVPNIHLDIGYSDFQGKVAELQARILGEAAALIREHPDFRFAMDGSWSLQQLLTTRSSPVQDEILRLIRDGKIGLPAQYCNLLTGYASLETLNRTLYYSKKLSREYGLPFDYANITDVPTYSGAYPSVLAGAGIKYWAAGGNGDRAPFLSHEQWNEKSPFWWEGPDGRKVLFWYSRCYQQTTFMFGLPPDLAAVRDSLPIFLQPYSKPNYQPDAVLMFGTQPENTDLRPTSASFADDWNRAYAYPRIRYSTFDDFFHYIDRRYGASLPTVKGDAGPYWEDGIGSDAASAAKDRENQNRALSADILSTVSQTIDPDLHAPDGLLADIWNNVILFAEHTWSASTSVSMPDGVEAVKQLAVKDDRPVRAALEIDDVVQRSLTQMADRIHVPARTLVVFNPVSWKRDALVETDLDERSGLEDLATHQPVPFEVLRREEGFLHVRFLAEDLPSVGYKCYGIEAAPEAAPPAMAPPPPLEVENRFYRLKVAPGTGAIESIFDKEMGRELVDRSSPYNFGQYLYVTGGDGTDGPVGAVATRTRIINAFKALPLAHLSIHPAGNGRLLGVEKTSWGRSIRLRSSDLNTPAVELEVLLYDRQKKIEFRYHVRKEYTAAKEGVYFAFPVALSSPRFAYATQMGWVDPARDLLKGASLEWFSIQPWMAAHDASVSVGLVPIDASLASFGDINRGEWPGEFRPKTSTLFSYVMNNYQHTNYLAGQGGDFVFRYVMTSARELDPGALTRLGWESMRPVEWDNVLGKEKVGDPERPLPAEGTGFLDIDAADVGLVTWKRAEDGNGLILRLQEFAGRPAEATLRFPHARLHSAALCNSVEDRLRDLPVDGNELKLRFQPCDVLTVRVVTDR